LYGNDFNDFNGFIPSPVQRNRRGLGGARPSLGTIAGFSLASLVLIAVAAFFLWDQHFGVPARMTVEYCSPGNKPLCYGVWRQGPAPEQTMYISGVGPEDVGHDVDVHFHPGSGRAPESDADITPLLMLAAGGISGVCAVIAIARRRRYARATKPERPQRM
jgi:hypothetical protein